MIIAIDGPASSGKSTISKKLAQKFNFNYLDTGAMYRMITLKVLIQKIDLNFLDDIDKLLKNTKIEYYNNEWYLDSVKIKDEIRTPEIDKNISKIADNKKVRDFLISMQREIGNQNDSILDGRDIGTVVFPDADLKFFLTASIQERAKRRFEEYKLISPNISIEDVDTSIRKRDKCDYSRKFGTLKKAADSIEIDTTKKNIKEVCDEITKYVNKALLD